jgi:hypothetical protein
MAEEKKKKTWVKWAIIVVVVVVVLIILYMLFKPGQQGNIYASAESLTKAKSGMYGGWKDAWNPDAIDKLKQLIPGEYSPGISNGDAYGRGWLKGMDLEPTLSNVNEFATDIEAYGKASFKKPHWEVTKGSFLTETATA